MSDGGCCHSRARADSPTHSRLTGIGLWGIGSTDPWFWLLIQILTTLLPQGSFWACTLPGWAQTKNQPCYHVHSTLSHLSIIANTLGPRRNRRHLADDIFKCIFLNGNVWILIKNSLKFVPKGPIRSSDNDSTGFWPPGSLHTMGADGHI